MVYIGETKRQLGRRVNEQAADCITAKRKGKITKNPKKNEVGLPKHALDHKHFFDFEQTDVLEEEKHWLKRKILEAIHIKLTPNPYQADSSTSG